MVILSVHNSADLYGASRCLLRLLPLFVQDGHSVHVVLPCAGPLVQLLQDSGITVHIFPKLAIIDRSELGTLKGKLAFPYRYLLSAMWIAKLVLSHGIDVVHTNTAVIPSAALAAKLTGRISVWHMREFFSEFQSAWRFYQYYLWALSTHIVVISAAVETQFAPSLRSKCTIVYDGLDASSMQNDPVEALRLRAFAGNPECLVAVVGRIKWVRKGQEIVVKAAALLRDRFPGVRYLIVGSVAQGNEDHLERLKELIRDRGVEDSFFFTGDIDDVRDVYAAVDITIVPSVQPEPFGCVVMESMAMGTPVIGSNCGGIPEQMVDGVTGLLFEPGNESELAVALAEMISDASLRARMGEASRDHFMEKFSMQDTYQKMQHLFCGK